MVCCPLIKSSMAEPLIVFAISIFGTQVCSFHSLAHNTGPFIINMLSWFSLARQTAILVLVTTLHCVIKLLRQQCNQIWQRKLRNEIEMNPLLPACNTHCFSHEKDLSKVYPLMEALLTLSLVIHKLHYFYYH